MGMRAVAVRGGTLGNCRPGPGERDSQKHTLLERDPKRKLALDRIHWREARDRL